jgi:hypothetical protein
LAWAKIRNAHSFILLNETRGEGFGHAPEKKKKHSAFTEAIDKPYI